MPLALYAAAAFGPVRYFTAALAASAFLAFGLTPAANPIYAWNSFGSGPASASPLADMISLISVIRISALPSLTAAAVSSAPDKSSVFDLRVSAIPMLPSILSVGGLLAPAAA